MNPPALHEIRERPENPFEAEGQWLRAALHTHTTGSDGFWPAEETARRYREAGFDVLVITDHNRVTPVEGLAADGLLVLPGQEMHPTGSRGRLYHLVAVGLPAALDCRSLSPQQAVDAARGAGAVVFMAHPSWCGLTSAEVNALAGLAGLEVWNATCLRHAKPSSEGLWDELLDAGRLLPAVAVDDCHRPLPGDWFPGDFCQGWTMVRAASRSPEAVAAALAAGRFYATAGPLIDDFRLVADASAPSGWAAAARFSPAREVWFSCRGWTGQTYVVPAGAPDLAEMRHPLKSGAGHVRLAVVDAAGRRAWSGPLVVPAAGPG